MSSLDSIQIAGRTITLFLLVDTSGSMQGNKIASVNDAIRNMLPILRDISEKTSEIKINIAALEFASDYHWMYSQPQSINDFQWLNIRADGWTALGKACLELNAKLSTNGFMATSPDRHTPIIILLSDGAPSDNFNNSIAILKRNPWFNNAIRIAIAIGNDANYDVLNEFTGTQEAIYEAYNTETLKSVISIATITATQFGSQSISTDKSNIQEQVVKNINQKLNNIHTSDTEDW
jgi:uncharacterized protein YegL